MTFHQEITYTFTGDVNDLRILKQELTERIRLDPNGADRTLSGIFVSDPSRSRLLFVRNIGSFQIEFLSQSGLSEVQNRFTFNEILPSGATFLLFYESADKRWNIISGSTAIVGGGEANTTSNQGGEVELALPKVGVDLPFRTLEGIDGVDVAAVGDVVQISGSTLQDQIDVVVEDIDNIEDDITAINAYTVIAGAGLTGGGLISSNPTLNVVALNSTIVVEADGIRADFTGLDHGGLAGLADDDHLAYILAEPSSTDNRLVRWDGITGRAVQTSGATLSDTDALTGLLSGAASSFFSAGGTVATAGSFRGDSSFTLQARDVGNSANVPLVSWASDDVTFGNGSYDTNILGLTIDIGIFRWPATDGSANWVMITNGAGGLLLADPADLFESITDHGALGGLSDDDHTQYVLAEVSSTDNRLVRWDGTGGRDIQTSGATLSDADALTGLVSATASSFISIGGTVATTGNLRGDSTFTLQARNVGNSANVPLLSWASDDVTVGTGTFDSVLNGLTVTIKGLGWPTSDGSANFVMKTNGAGQLSLAAVTSLLDHDDLSGLADDDHTQYMLAEPSATDNRLVRWDGTTGRDVQTSGATLSDTNALTGLLSAAASSFVSVGGTVATAGNLRGDSAFTLQARNAGNSADVALVSWASDDVAFGQTGFDTDIRGLTIDIGLFRWPVADGAANTVMTTNGAGVLSLVAVTSLFDHGTLGGLTDDDHLQYMLAEPSSTDNRLVRWDGTGGRSVQTSGTTLSDTEALSGLLSAAASSFVSVGGTVATAGNLRGDSTFTLQARNVGNSANVPLVSWASDDVGFGSAANDTDIFGLTIDIGPLRWPVADGAANTVMTTNGAGVLSLVSVTSLFDHGNLTGLSDDDHTQYILAEPSSTDNRLVRWDGTGGRAVQTSGTTLSDTEALSGLLSAAASSFVSVGGTVATAGNLRGDSTFTLQVRDAGNTTNAPLVSWATDDVTFGHTGFDTNIVGLTIDIGLFRWPSVDGASANVMTTNGAGVLSLAAVTSLFDHDDLTGLADDDHLQYMLAEPSSTDNRLVRWDGTGGRSVQTSGTTLSDTEAMSGLASAAASGFFSVGSTVATAGNIRGDASFTLQARNSGNSANVPLVAWVVDDAIFGTGTFDSVLNGSTVTIKGLGWPTADGVANAVMKTNGTGQLSLVALSTLVDHGTLGGLADDDHSQYMHSEASSTDNRIVRWDGTGGRDVQTSAVTISDAGNMDMAGGSISTVDDLTMESTGPIFSMINTAGSLNGKWWRISTGPDDLAFSMRDDAGANINTVLNFSRTGATFNAVEFPAAYVTANRVDTSGVLTDNVAGSTNNYSLGSTLSHVRFTASGTDPALTGITGGTQGREIKLTNIDDSGQTVIFLRNESSSSTAANRILTPDGQDFALTYRASVTLFYDDTSDRWRVLSQQGVTKWQWRGVLQTTGSAAVEIFSLPMPIDYVYVLNAYVASRRDVSAEPESGHAISHFEGVYKRYSTGNAVPPSDGGTGGILVSTESLARLIEINSGQVRLRLNNSTTSVSVAVDPASAVDWRHNWVVEIMAMPMDNYI